MPKPSSLPNASDPGKTAVFLAVTLFCAIPHAMAAPAQTASWHTGAAFRQQLDLPVGLSWSANPLRRALANLARSQRVAIFLDRRVDPDQTIDLTVANEPLEALLHKIAATKGIGVSFVGPVVYFGPKATARKVATLVEVRREELRRLPAAARSRLVRARRSHWEDLATPQELLDRWASETGVKIVGAERIEHDLWPAADLPALGAVERLTLLLVGFDMTFEFAPDGTAVRIVRIPEEVVLRKTYSAGGKASRLAALLRERFPEARTSASGGTVVVTGSAEAHEAIARLLRGEPVKRRTVEKERVYTLTVENAPADAIVKEIERQTGLRARYAPELVPRLKKQVTLRVENVSLDELLRKTLNPVGLSYRIGAETIEILPSDGS